MAVEIVNFGYTPAAATNYTVVTDSSADWPSVTISTWLYNKADKIVYYKNSAGVVINPFLSSLSLTTGTIPVAASSSTLGDSYLKQSATGVINSKNYESIDTFSFLTITNTYTRIGYLNGANRSDIIFGAGSIGITYTSATQAASIGFSDTELRLYHSIKTTFDSPVNFFSSFTPSTIVYSNASRNLVSLANGPGVLTNNGSGVLTWVSGGVGTVTSVNIATANGISATGGPITTSGSFTITLGAITPSSVNGNTITTGTGTLTLSSFTLTVAGTSSVSGTNTGDQTNITGNAGTVTNGLYTTNLGVTVQAYNANTTIQGNSFNGASQLVQLTAATKYPALDGSLITNITAAVSGNLTGPITSVGNATSIAAQTGTGSVFVVQNTPTLTTPVLGIATATSINKLTITAPTTSATLTLIDGSSLITVGAFVVTLTSTATTGITLPTSGTLYSTKTGSITSAQMLASMSDPTGTGLSVFATAPTFTTSITTPLILGGSAVGSQLTLQGSSGNGTSSVAAIVGNVGNAGASNAFNIYNDLQFLYNTTTRNATSFGIFKIAQGTSFLEFGEAAAGSGAIWISQPSNTNANYVIKSATNTNLNAQTSGTVLLSVNNVTKASFGSVSASFTPATSTSTTNIFSFTAPASATTTASTEVNGFVYSLTTNRQYATGNISGRQAEILLNAPTYRAVGASIFTDPASVWITGSPIAFTNMTFTNTHGLYIGISAVNGTGGAATNSYGLTVNAQTGATNNYAAQFLGGLGVLFSDINIVFGTATGTKIGTATTQKLSFWNSTPVIQPTTGVAASTFVANTSGIANDTATFDGYTLGQIVKALRNIGLLA